MQTCNQQCLLRLKSQHESRRIFKRTLILRVVYLTFKKLFVVLINTLKPNLIRKLQAYILCLKGIFFKGMSLTYVLLRNKIKQILYFRSSYAM